MPVADEVYKGLNEFTEQPLKQVEKPGEPVRTIRTYEGPRAKVDDKVAQLKLDYQILNMEVQRSAPSIITIETAEGNGTEDPDLRVLAEIVWELDWEREMRDIRSHGYFNTSGTSASIMEKIDLAIRKGNAAETDWDTTYSIPHMNDYRDCKLRGINTYMAFAPTIRATLTMGKFTKLQAPSVDAQGVVGWDEIRVPYSGAASTPAAAGIEQPTLRIFPDAGSAFELYAVDQFLMLPVRRSFSSSNRRYTMNFEWLGAYEYTGALYYRGTGKPPA